jgi:hypothetical protein
MANAKVGRALALVVRMPNTLLRFVAWLLHLANADPPITRRREFYALKQRLVERWGVRVGDDVQRYRRECYGYQFDGCEGKTCRKCYGTGVFSESWVLLERWEFGGYVFHRPVGPTRPRAVDYIDGRITHAGVSHRAANEAALWLALLFDRRLFCALLTTSRNCGWQWRPMLALQAVVFDLRMFVGAFYVRRCDRCARWTFRYSPRSHLCVVRCRRCERVSQAAFAAFVGESQAARAALFTGGDDDDLPF